MAKSATNLVYTSVQDMQSSLHSWGVEDLPLLRAALSIATKRGEKTKVKILSAKIKKLEKKRIRSIYLERLEDAFEEVQ